MRVSACVCVCVCIGPVTVLHLGPGPAGRRQQGLPHHAAPPTPGGSHGEPHQRPGGNGRPAGHARSGQRAREAGEGAEWVGKGRGGGET